MGVEIDIEELKKIQLSLLSAVHKVCQEQHLRYSLGGGTLLGAVRHKGYIPWDDDIDIMMPRPDYDAFIAYCLSHDVGFKIRNWETDKTYVDLSAKVYDPDTLIIDEVVKKEGDIIGVSIDIFPVDGLADTYKKAKKVFNSTRFKRELLVAAQWDHFFKSKTHPWYYEPIRFAMYVLSRCTNKSKVFAKVVKRHTSVNFESVAYAAAVGGSYRNREILPREVFTELTTLPFEELEFCAIKAYDTYLSSIYGNYMQLPPEEKRVSHHTFKAYYR